ncbi:ATP-binding cassette sub-family G member [Paragonimus heterotremus]|uniref:ATP-binding cassette sub-family G member n=1 Tax=Paragonimus heterotremus TaxID=100268 RepID=A0A8J4T3C6_9TREM|nr:ATP-binding cassette sub-family G member [Paragonimus heterotremus]
MLNNNKRSASGNSGETQRESITKILNNKGKELRFDGIKYHVFKGRGIENKFILKDISGVFKSGQLSAIMGPSGAGKSSLMNILAGYRTKNVSGNTFVNKEERDPHEFRKITSYIMQDDLLLPHLSVEETMMCSANLKLSEGTDRSTKKMIVHDILNVLSLGDAIHTRTSQLSGGQKKRLAIAQELVNNPPVMFFDEPTSGLDSASCFHCISLLQTLARGGRTIICTIHQPSAKVFEMFDYLYFLAEGHCIYRGPVSCLVPYLASQDLVCPPYHNPADFFMEVACGTHGDNVLRLACAVRRGVLDEAIAAILSKDSNKAQVIEATNVPSLTSGWGEHASGVTRAVDLSLADGQEHDSLAANDLDIGTNAESHSLLIRLDSSQPKVKSVSLLALHSNGPVRYFSEETTRKTREQNFRQGRTYETRLWTQFCVLFKRSFFSIIRDTTLTHLRLVSHVVVGVLIGLLYFRIGNLGNEVISNAAFIFFTLLFIMFAALMPTVMTFPVEMPIFVREHMNYWYSLKAYYLAKSFADLPFQVFFPIVYGSIVYWMTEQPTDAIRFLLFLLVCIQTSLVGQSLGLLIGAATSLQVAVFLGPVTGIPILLFSGFFLSLDLIPKYLQWLSYISFTRYSFSGALKIIYGLNRTKLDCSQRRSITVSFPCVQNPSMVIDSLNVGQYHLYVDILILFLFFFALRLMSYFILRWRIKGQR